MNQTVRTRAPRRDDTGAEPVRDPDVVRSFLEDAAHFTGGHAAAVAFPRTEADVARLVRGHSAILPVGAQSSVTGGATPMGELVVASTRLDRIVEMRDERVRVEAGVPIATLQDALASRGLYYPPAPTYNGAFVGGTLATNASGAATFKYGSTRRWVHALTVVLASGEVLDIERGQALADAEGGFDLESASGERLRIPVPRYAMPRVPKLSAGYFAAPGMDLVDLFIGSEGTLGVIVEATLDVVSPAPTTALALVPCPTEAVAVGLAGTLRSLSLETRAWHDPLGLDVSAIEDMDRRSLEILREDGADRRHHVRWPAGTEVLLLVEVGLPSWMTTEEAFAQVAVSREWDAPDTPLVRFCRELDAVGLLDETEMAMPGDRRRAQDFFELREAVPSGVKQRIATAKERVHPSIEKTAADMIVPFDRFAEMLALYHAGCQARGLDYAIWGHLSDAHVHPNVIPRSVEEMHEGRKAILQFGRAVVALGGCPLAEHGVGRSPVKQALLRELYGESGIAGMRAVKQAFDPQWKLSPGVLFPEAGRPPATHDTRP